ncbi:MAG: hypothetical protein AAF483_08455 [Planctomycetota bacterium]
MNSPPNESSAAGGQTNPFEPPSGDGGQLAEKPPHKPLSQADKIVLLVIVGGGSALEAAVFCVLLAGIHGPRFEVVLGFLSVTVPAATFFAAVFWAFISVTRGEDFIVGRIIKATVFATVATPAAYVLLVTTCSAIAIPTQLMMDDTAIGKYGPYFMALVAAALMVLLSLAAIFIILRQRLWR